MNARLHNFFRKHHALLHFGLCSYFTESGNRMLSCLYFFIKESFSLFWGIFSRHEIDFELFIIFPSFQIIDDSILIEWRRFQRGKYFW